LLGALFESLVTQSVRAYAQAAEATVHHFRTERGRQEVGVIARGLDHRIVAIVVSTGPFAYRRADGIGVVPAALLGP